MVSILDWTSFGELRLFCNCFRKSSHVTGMLVFIQMLAMIDSHGSLCGIYLMQEMPYLLSVSFCLGRAGCLWHIWRRMRWIQREQTDLWFTVCVNTFTHGGDCIGVCFLVWRDVCVVMWCWWFVWTLLLSLKLSLCFLSGRLVCVCCIRAFKSRQHSRIQLFMFVTFIIRCLQTSW